MANTEFYSAADAVENKQSFYNVIRETGSREAQFWNSLSEGIPFKGDPNRPHEWYFRPNPKTGKSNVYGEGSKRATVTKWPTQKLSNVLQILKQTSGLSESQMAAMTVEDQTNSLTKQKDANRKQIKLDVEYALLGSADFIESTDSDGNRMNTMAGALHYAGLVIDAADTDTFDYDKHIIEPLKYMWKEGVTEDKVIMCGTEAKTALNKYLQANKRYGGGETSITTNIKSIADSGWGENIDIKANANLGDNDIVIYAPSLVNPVVLRAVKDKDCSDPNYDGVAYEDIFEMTVQVEDPNAIVYVKNLKTA